MVGKTMQKHIQDMTAEQLHMACEAANVGTYAYKIDSDETQWNSVFRRLIGYSDTEVITLEEFLTHVNPEDVPGIRARMKAILAGEIEEYTAEYRVTPIGQTEEIWIGFRGKVRPGTNIMFGIVTDITERKKKQEYLIECLKNAETNLGQVQEFITIIKNL